MFVQHHPHVRRITRTTPLVDAPEDEYWMIATDDPWYRRPHLAPVYKQRLERAHATRDDTREAIDETDPGDDDGFAAERRQCHPPVAIRTRAPRGVDTMRRRWRR